MGIARRWGAASSAGGNDDRLLGPDQDLGSVPVSGVEQKARTAPFNVLDGQPNAVGIDLDAVVVEEREMAGRYDTEEPERDRYPYELAGAAIVGEHADGFQPLLRFGLHHLAVDDRFVAVRQFDQWPLAGKAGPRQRELLARALLAREGGIHVPVDEERDAPHRRHRQHADDDDAGNEDGRPGRDPFLGHMPGLTKFTAPCSTSVAPRPPAPDRCPARTDWRRSETRRALPPGPTASPRAFPAQDACGRTPSCVPRRSRLCEGLAPRPLSVPAAIAPGLSCNTRAPLRRTSARDGRRRDARDRRPENVLRRPAGRRGQAWRRFPATAGGFAGSARAVRPASSARRHTGVRGCR